MGLTLLNKNMLTLDVSGGDGQRLCDTPLAAKPDGYVRVHVLWIGGLATGETTDVAAYWSNDNGATALAYGDLQGDGTEYLYWNPSRSGQVQLQADQQIEFDYIEAVVAPPPETP